jgi:starvation-inducible DNA-binding protein
LARRYARRSCFSDKLGDADTADLYTGVSRDADKYRWFLEAYLHSKR